jgi:ABC-type antimicrobial peptide transport system permease subunit
MFRTRGRKILRDIWARKGRTFLVSMAIFIGVGGTVALLSLNDIVVRQLRKDVKESELSMLQVYVSANAGVQLDDATYLQKLHQEVAGLTEVMGEAQVYGYFKLKPEDTSFEQGVVTGYSAPFEPELPIEPMRLIKGQYPVEGQNEVVVEKRMAEEYGLKVGDKLYFRILSPSRDPNLGGKIDTLEEWTVSGIVFHPYSLYAKTAIYANLDDTNYLGAMSGLNVILARFVDYPTAEGQQEKFKSVVADETPYHIDFAMTQDPKQNQFVQNAQTIAGLMSILAVIALVVSGFLVINVINSIVVEQKRQIGVMKSIGASRWDSFVMYSGMAFFYGLIGVIPGVIVGIPVGDITAHALAPTVNTVLSGFQISVPSIVTGVVMGLLIPVLFSLVPVANATRVQIVQAMTDLGINVRYGGGVLAHIIEKLPLPISVRQGLSNISIKKVRLLLTVITLTVAVGAFMGIYAVFNTLTSGLNSYFNTFDVHFFMAPNEGRDPSQIIPILEQSFQTPQNDLFKTIQPGYQLQIAFEGYNPKPTTGGPPGIFAYGYDTTSDVLIYKITLKKGSLLTPETADNGIILSTSLASAMNKTVGDQVVVIISGNKEALKVVGIADFPLDQAWMDWRTMARITKRTIGAPVPNQYFTQVKIAGYPTDQPVFTAGLDTQFSAAFAFSSGQFFTPGQPGIIVSQTLADKGGYKVGDTLTLEATTTGGSTAEVPIVGIFQIDPAMLQGLQKTAPQGVQISDEIVGMYWEDLAKLEGVSLEGNPMPQGYLILTTIKHPTAKQIKKIMDDTNEVMLQNGIPCSFFNFVELIQQINQIFTTFQLILSIVAGLIAVVGALGLLITLSMSVFERQKEIGVMRSIGASSRTIATQFLTEGVIVGVLAWLIGIPIAIGIEYMLLTATKLIETFPVTFPVTAAATGLIGMLVITTLASLGPSLAAARKTVSDILRYQ